MHAHTTARAWRSRLCLVASLATILLGLTALHASVAAGCTTGGASCVPGTGYTFDDVWDCGSIVGASCFYDSTTTRGSATNQTWGWGSAAYNAGGGDVFVCIQGAPYFTGCAFNLARACYFTDCNDQDLVAYPLWVTQSSGLSRQIFGHGKA